MVWSPRKGRIRENIHKPCIQQWRHRHKKRSEQSCIIVSIEDCCSLKSDIRHFICKTYIFSKKFSSSGFLIRQGSSEEEQCCCHRFKERNNISKPPGFFYLTQYCQQDDQIQKTGRHSQLWHIRDQKFILNRLQQAELSKLQQRKLQQKFIRRLQQELVEQL